MSAHLGQTVRTRRKKLGLSQEELAWRAELDRTYVSDVERGVRNLSLLTLERLARALQTSVSGLFRSVDLEHGLAADPASGEPAQVTILLVEDNPDDVALTLRTLRRARLVNHIHVVPDGLEALNYLFDTARSPDGKTLDRPHLVLLDLKLPRMDGMEVLRRIKSDPRTLSTPVVVVTGSEATRDVAEAQTLGADAYLTKPVNFQRLCEVTPKLADYSWSLLRLPLTLAE